MKKRNLIILSLTGILILTILNVNVTSTKFSDVTISSLKNAFSQDPEFDLSKYWKSYPSCYNDNDNSWCCLSTQCLPQGPDDCNPNSCPPGTHL